MTVVLDAEGVVIREGSIVRIAPDAPPMEVERIEDPDPQELGTACAQVHVLTLHGADSFPVYGYAAAFVCEDLVVDLTASV